MLVAWSDNVGEQVSLENFEVRIDTGLDHHGSVLGVEPSGERMFNCHWQCVGEESVGSNAVCVEEILHFVKEVDRRFLVGASTVGRYRQFDLTVLEFGLVEFFQVGLCEVRTWCDVLTRMRWLVATRWRVATGRWDLSGI